MNEYGPTRASVLFYIAAWRPAIAAHVHLLSRCVTRADKGRAITCRIGQAAEGQQGSA